MERPNKMKNIIPNSSKQLPKKKKQKKTHLKKKSIPKPSTSGLLRKNSFDALSNLNDKEVILLDSDDDNDTQKVNNENNNNNEHETQNSNSSPIEVTSSADETIDNIKNELSTIGSEHLKLAPKEDIKDNADFIGFDFSDSGSDDHFQDDAENYDDDNNNNNNNNNSDNAYDEKDDYLSNDEEGSKTYRQSPRPKLNPEYPWLKSHDHSSKIEIVDWLNLEIKDFVNYISPSKEEISMRNEVYKKIKYLIVTQLWPDCDVQVFGSFATDLYLPGSDIDLVITSVDAKYDTRAHLYQLSAFLRRSGLGVNIETIAKAKVPIIKFVEPDSRIHIDVSFERTNGLTALMNIRHWLSTTPGLRELVLIIKQFLLVRKLNDVHVGGLGGYSIICLLYSFLKLHPRLATNSIDPMENLGILLIEFFELYGLNFGYDNVAILFDPKTKEPYYLPKKLYPDLLMKNLFAILIRDPDDPSNNISRGSFNIRDIKRSFGGAFQLLANKCYDLNSATYKTRLNESILGGVIKYKGKERDFNDARNDVTNEAMVDYPELVKLPLSEMSMLPPLPSKLKRRKLNKKLHLEQQQEQPKELVTIHKSENDIHYYSDYSSDDDTSAILNIVEESQDTTKKVKKINYDDKQKLINALFGIKSDESDKEDVISVERVDENSSMDDEMKIDTFETGSNDDENSVRDIISSSEEDKDEDKDDLDEKVKVDKSIKRDYWTQKGGL